MLMAQSIGSTNDSEAIMDMTWPPISYIDYLPNQDIRCSACGSKNWSKPYCFQGIVVICVTCYSPTAWLGLFPKTINIDPSIKHTEKVLFIPAVNTQISTNCFTCKYLSSHIVISEVSLQCERCKTTRIMPIHLRKGDKKDVTTTLAKAG